MYWVKNTQPYSILISRAFPSVHASPTFIRNIRIKPSGGEDERPTDSHVLERKDQSEGKLDPQAQNAQSSMKAPLHERPAYVHGRVSKGDVTGGASTEGKENATPLTWWERMKQKLGFGKWKKGTR